MLQLIETTRFGRDRKRLKKQGKNFAKLKAVIVKLANGETLEALTEETWQLLCDNA